MSWGVGNSVSGSELLPIVAVATFLVVILVIAFNWLDMTVAAMLGVVVFLVTGILTDSAVTSALATGDGTLALLFGGMVVARVLVPTGIFEVVGQRLLRFTNGSGKRLLLALLLIVAPVCALLPNATVVLLLGPVIVRVAKAMEIDFIPLLVLTAVISNAAGLLTLVGDPATFLVGSAIHWSFTDYLGRVSFGGLLALAVIVPLMPVLFGDIWRLRRPPAADLPPAKLQQPLFVMVAVGILLLMVALFVFGSLLPTLTPPSVAILGATLALMAIYGWRVEPVGKVFSDIDWKTLIFILCMFFMVQGLVATGVLQGVSRLLAAVFGDHMLAAALVLLAAIGAASSVLANIPVVVAMLVLVKGYLVLIDAVPEQALGHTFQQVWPEQTIPVFVGMMFGATLGGSATLIGASANVVAAGIAAQNGRVLTFARFARYGVPIVLAQLAVGAIYTVALSLLAAG